MILVFLILFVLNVFTFRLCWVFDAVWPFLYSLDAVCKLFLQWLLFLWSTGSRCVGFISCGSQAPRAQAQYLWSMGLVAAQHVGS